MFITNLVAKITGKQFIISFMLANDLKFITRNIRKLRQCNHLSQRCMATKLGIGQNTYNKIESGKTSLTLQHLFYIADVLGVDATELLKESVVFLRCL